MAESRRRSGELKRGVLTILSQQPEGLPAREVIARMEKLYPPTPFERSDYPKQPGVRRYNKIIRFTTISPVKAGWITKNKGVWTITDEGRRVLEQFKDPEALQREADRLYSEWEDGQPDEVEPTSAPAASSTFEEASEAAWCRKLLGCRSRIILVSSIPLIFSDLSASS
jgi:restriction system protein